MSDLLSQAQLHPQQMLANLETFMEKIKQLAQLAQLDIHNAKIDHIALRVNDDELARLAHHAWQAYGQEISAAQINGRPIVVFEFYRPLIVEGWSIECLELPYPVSGKRYPQQSWEHIEVVMAGEGNTAQEYLESLLMQHPKMAQVWPTLTQLGIQVKLSSPKGDGERLSNPTVALKWQGVTLKIHPHSLKHVIAILFAVL